MKTTLLVLSLSFVAAQWGASASKSASPDFGNLLDSMVINPATDVWGASVGLANDFLGYVLATPQGVADFFVYCVGHVRALPTFGRQLFDGQQCAIDSATSFAAGTAASVFALYAAVAALNLLLSTLCTAKNAFVEYMHIPTRITVPIVNINIDVPAPIVKLFDVIDEQLLARVRDWNHDSFWIPLQGHNDNSLANMVSATAAAASACMLLSCAPGVVHLIQNGANKGEAEALLYTAGAALAIQWGVKKAA
jgi:hypothetical protein